jgi:hypothetical protein
MEDQPVTRGERVLAAACLLGSVLVAFMAADIMTGGVLTRSLTRGGQLPAETEAYLRSRASAAE